MKKLAVPNENTPVRKNWFLKVIGRIYLYISGWRLIGEFPDVPKCVTPIAPHTSNWDAVHGLACVLATELGVVFLGKHTLFSGPLGKFLTWMGGIPVNRDNPRDLIDQVADQLDDMDKAIMAVSPEGTRKKTEKWKTGFLRIAYKTNLPVVPAYLDYPTKTIAFLPPVELTGDIDKDLEAVKAAFKPYRGKNIDQQ